MLLHLTNARLYAPEPLGLRDVLIAGERLVDMGEPGSLSWARAADTVDLEGRKVIPGLIDGHAHLTGGGGESGYASRVPPVPLSRFTRAGVTSVVGVLGTDDVTRSTESLVAAAYGLREEGIGAWCHCGGYHLPPVTFSGSVRRDIVFVDPVIGVGEVAISDHRSSQPTLDEILRLAGDAHVAGMMTGKAGILHLHLGDGSRGLELIDRALATSEIPARVFNPTHVNRQRALLDEAVDLARRGSTVDITAYPVAEDDPSVPAAVALAEFLESGAPADKVTISSDGGGCLPHFDGDGVLERMDIGNPAVLLETLAAIVADGFALERALPAFTSNAASLLRLAGRGRLAIGSIADLVVLDDDGGAHSVMARGRWHVRERETVVRGTFENQVNP
jgi:beta-aspartyl-dipeptidase (metallo-type)